MTSKRLPFVPHALPDESLSSWVERIALFYGGNFELGLGILNTNRGRLFMHADDDLDTDADARDAVAAWSRSDLGRVPNVFDPDTIDTLVPPARVTYCPACWDDDVRAGHQPYMRRRWMRWPVVHCEVHRTWLRAKRPREVHESRHQGWAGMWQSRANWAASFELRHMQPFDQMLVGFDPQVIELPMIDWHALDADLKRFERSHAAAENRRAKLPLHRSILTAVQFTPLEPLCYRVAEYVAPKTSCADILNHLRSTVALWHSTRLMLMLIAVEYLRLVEDREPVDATVAAMVSSYSALKMAVGMTRKRNERVPASLTNGETIKRNLTNDETCPQSWRQTGALR